MAGRKSARIPTAQTTQTTLPRSTRSGRIASLVVAASATAEQSPPRSEHLNSLPTPEQVQVLFQQMTALVGQYQQLLQAPPQPPPGAMRPVQERPSIHKGESSRHGEDRTHHSTRQRREDKPPRRDKSPLPQKRDVNFTPLNTARKHILAAISEEDFVKWPARMISKGNRRDPSKYCRFHKDHGHDTDDCWQLKEEIKQLIGRGYLKKYVRTDGRKQERRERSPRGHSPQRSQPSPPRNKTPQPANTQPEVPRSQPRGVIGTIMGGPAAGGSSSAARKAYARRINVVHTTSKKTRTENEISFSDADLDNLILPHDDALVKMMIGDDRLKPASSDLFGFSGEVVKVEGQIELPVLVGEPPRQAFAMVNFLVVRATSVYNAILGRPGQNLIRAVASAYHQKMKFITPNGVGEVRGDQPQSRECYAMALKGKNTVESLPIELLDVRDELRGTQPTEDLISIPLCPEDSEKVALIGSSISSSIQHQLTEFLQDNADVFAWVPADMPGIDPEISMHRLGVDSTCRPVKQKKRHFTFERQQIGRNMEVYVDDMLVKSRSAQDHVSDLKETFQVLKKHSMKLNPTKCTFGVSSGKFLGFMVSQRGIEANPEKIKVVMELTAPKTIREVQRLTGMIAALGRFISKSAERCLPFFSAVRGLKTAPWTEDCQTTFEELKKYLSSPPLLTKPEPGEELFLYLSISSTTLAPVLVREERRQQKPIYYVSKAHTIKVLTDQPLRQVLHRPDISGRLVKWAVELSEFDIQYAPRPAIKAQVLADFVAECTIPQQLADSEVVQLPVAEEAAPEECIAEGTETGIVHPPAEQGSTINPLTWEVHVDGSSNKSGCGAGLVLTGPDDFTADYALRFGFRASNNEAEYEALLAGMSLAPQTGARNLKAYCDSQLVANQIQGVYEARDERMIKYLAKVHQLASKFQSFEVIRVPRTENAKADVLSKLAASGYTTLGSIRMEFLQGSSIEIRAAETMQVENEPCWMDEIITYLRDGKLPEDKKEARKVIQRAARFSLSDDILYKRSYTLPYLKCLRPGDATYALQETHEGICGEHLGGKALAIKVLLRGLYWPTVRQDALSLVKRCERYELYHVLWAYHTTPRTPTGESPFNLSFGTEAVIPVDIGTPSPRVTSFNEQLNGDGLRANLDLLEEIREESRIRVAAYKQKISNYHDSKIRPREFRTGDLVLRRAAVSQPTKVGKLSPTWEGPYRVKEIIRPGSYKLETLEEHLLLHAWNSKNLRKYYQ
ncbi:uncharacterized protein LOC143870036 [Tasmannia lanceolata]|uniref:uncharacterized protein LOC143870036 n=1 Tax=Tasmannia lanceolata TaxID=3420 RepID=UPI0040628A40